jgi:hypothetical protein
VKGESTGASHAIRVRLLNLEGEELQMPTRKLAAPGGMTVWELPLAVDLAAGRYTLDAVEIPAGAMPARALSIRWNHCHGPAIGVINTVVVFLGKTLRAVRPVNI